jgi:hypothetical protein
LVHISVDHYKILCCDLFGHTFSCYVVSPHTTHLLLLLLSLIYIGVNFNTSKSHRTFPNNRLKGRFHEKNVVSISRQGILFLHALCSVRRRAGNCTVVRIGELRKDEKADERRERFSSLITHYSLRQKQALEAKAKRF